MSTIPTALPDIRSLSLEELTSALLLLGEKPFRARQVYECIGNAMAAFLTRLPVGSEAGR